MDEGEDPDGGKEPSDPESSPKLTGILKNYSLENEEKIKTEDSIDMISTSFESTEEKLELANLLAEKIRKLLFTSDNIHFTQDSLNKIKNFAEEPKQQNLIIGEANNELVATFLSSPDLETFSKVTFFVKQKNESLNEETFLAKVSHFSLPMDVKSASLHLMRSTFANNFIFDNEMWPETMKTKLKSNLHDYFMAIYDDDFSMKNLTFLYVPLENLTGNNSDLVGQMEDAVSRWYEQISVCVNSEDLNSKLPKLIDLINFWDNKYKNMSFLEDQLHSKAFEKILDILLKENSYSGKMLQEITASVESAKTLAMLNMVEVEKLRPFSIKLENCTNFKESTAIISDTLNQIWSIWKNSKYFNENNRVSKLLVCLGNQIIQTCSRTIPLKSLLKGKPMLGMSTVHEATSNCKNFISIYKEQFSKIANVALESPREIFSSIYSFANRCKDLSVIFQAMIIFGRMNETKKGDGPSFAGANGRMFEETCEQIREDTLEAVREISIHYKIALDVANTQWQGKMDTFSHKMAKVERSIEALVNSVMDDTSNIYEGLNSLHQLLHYLQKSSLEHLLKQKSNMLYGMLLKEVEKSSHNLLGGKLMGYSGFPPFSGTALMVHNGRSYLVSQMLMLEESKFLAKCDMESAATKELAFFVSVADETIQEIYDRWVIDLPIDWEAKLRRPLIAFHPAYDTLIEPTLGSDIFETIEEIRVWKSLGFEAPEKMQELFALEDNLCTLRDDVQIVCHQYNEAIQEINPEDLGLFVDRLSKIKEDIKPAMFSYSWLSKSLDEYLQRRLNSTLNFKKLVRELNSRKRKLELLCCSLSNSEIMEINSTDFYSFSDVQRNFEVAIKTKFEELLACFDKLKEHFGEISSNVQPYWDQFYQNINDLIDSGALTIVRRSYKKLLNAFIEVPFFINIEANLEDNQIVYSDVLSDFQTKIEQAFDFHLCLLKTVPTLLDLLHEGKHEVKQESLEEKAKNDSNLLEIKALLEIEMEKLRKGVINFTNKWEILSWLWKINIEDFLENYRQQNLSAASISNDLERFTLMLADADLPNTATTAFIKLDMTAVKTKVAVLAKTWQAAMIKFILNSALGIARKIYKALIDDIKKLNHEPESLQEVAEKTVFCQFTIGHMKSIESQLETLNEYCTILTNYKVTFPDELTQLLASNNEEWDNYLLAIQVAKNSLEKSKDKFRTSMIEKGNLLSRDLSKLCSKVHNDGPFNCEWNEKDAFKFLVDVKTNLIKLHSSKEHLSGDFEIFGVDPPRLAEIQNMEKMITMLKEVWSVRKEWNVCWKAYQEKLFKDLQVKETQAKIEGISAILRALANGPAREWQVVEQTRAEVENLKHGLPIVCKLRETALRNRHWLKIQKIINKEFDASSDDFTLQFVLSLGMVNFEEDIRTICSHASEEESIEKGLAAVNKDWQFEKIQASLWETNFPTFHSFDKLFGKIDQSLDKLAVMESSQNVGAFILELKCWQKKLECALFASNKLMNMQCQLLKIQPVRSSNEGLIEHDLKLQILGAWGIIISAHENAKNCIDQFQVEDVHELENLLKKAEKQVANFMRDRLKEAPRLYFLNLHELLELFLNPYFKDHRYQENIAKCFPGISSLKIGRQENEVLGVCTPSGEVLLFNDSLKVSDSVAEAIDALEDEMKAALQTLQARCCAGLAKNPSRSDRWIKAFPGQTLILAGQIHWTAELERAVAKCNRNDSRKPLKQLKAEQEIVIARLSENLSGPLSGLERLKITAFLTSEMFLNRKTSELIKSDNIDPASMEILSLLKFFWNEEESELVVQQMLSSFKYAFQLYGDPFLPVITPSMDKYILHITTALHMQMSVNLQGPAKSGKFETINGLANLLGKIIITFCCNKTTSINEFEVAIEAIAKLGAWGIFKDLLAVPSQQLQQVSYHLAKFLRALGNREGTVKFHRTNVTPHPDTTIFLTLTRMDRNELVLPATLRSHFRPVAIRKLDASKILEMIMIGEGYSDANSLASKFIQIELCCKTHFSTKSAWIFENSSAVINIVNQAIKRKRIHSTLSEEEAALHALVSNIEPQLPEEDLKTFQFYVAQIFPGVELITDENNILREALVKSFLSHNLEPLAHQIENGMKFFSALQNNSSVILVGRTGRGKSTVLKILIKALEKLKIPGFTPIKVHSVHPSSMNFDELYGFRNGVSWVNGTLQNIIEEIQHQRSDGYHWIYFDGKISNDWVENLHKANSKAYSYLIGGKEFDLTNSKVKIIFETDSLEAVNPNSICQFTSVFFESEVGWKSIVEPWLQKLNEGPLKLELKLLISESLQRCFDFKRESCKEVVEQNEFAAAQNFCTILQSLLKNYKKTSTEKETILMAKNWFYFSVVWGIFGAVEEEFCKLVDEFIRSLETGIYPKNETVFDYFVDCKIKKFAMWSTKLPKVWRYDEKLAFHEIKVPSVINVKFNYLVDIFVREQRPVLLSGYVGSGKSFICDEILASLDPESFYSAKLSATSKTNKECLMEAIANKLQPRSNNSFSHWKVKTLLLLLEDINLMLKNELENQPALEVLRQWLDDGFWFDKNLHPTHVKDIRIVALMSHRGIDLNVSERLKSKFAILNVPYPADKELVHIFGSILSQHLLNFGEHIKVLGNLLVESTIELHRTLKDTLVANLENPQCVFSLKVLSQVVQGLLLSNKDHHNTQNAMCKLWINEVYLAYGARLTDKRRKDALKEEILYITMNKLSITHSELYPGKVMPIIGMYSEKEDEAKDQIEYNTDNAKRRLEVLLQKFNDFNKEKALNLLIVDDTVHHVTRLVRILSQPSNHNILMLGEAGNGRKSLVKFATFICGLHCIETDGERIKVDGKNRFKIFWKAIILRAAFENERIALIYDNSQNGDEITIELISSLIENGAVCGLFTLEELETLSEAHKCDAEKFMAKQAKKNLRHVLNIPMDSKILRNLMFNFPALLKCNVDIFEPWCFEKLMQAAHNYLEKITDKDMDKERISECFAQFHWQLSEEAKRLNWKVAITPVSLFESLHIYHRTIKENQIEFQSKKEVYTQALQKMSASSKKLAGLSANLLQAQRKVVESQRQCETALVTLGQRKREVEEQKILHEKKLHQIEQEEISIQQLARLAHQAMDEAIPCLEDADLALESIEANDLQTLRSYGRPPPLVESVISAVMLMKQTDPTWAEAKRQLADPKFIEQLINFDKDRVPEKTLKAVASITNNEDFNLDKIEATSNGAKLLAQWVLAMEKFGKIHRVAAPKRSKLERASKELREHQAELADISSKMSSLKLKLEEQKEEHKNCLEDKQVLDAKVEAMATELQRANDLLTSLSLEEQEWSNYVDNFDHHFKSLYGDCMFLSIQQAYLGPLKRDQRKLAKDKISSLLLKLQIEHGNCSLCTNKEADLVERDWVLKSLHDDVFMKESAKIVLRFGTAGSELNEIRPVLLLDPQDLGKTWLTKELEGNKISVNNDCQNLEKSVADAMRTGKILFVTGFRRKIEPSLLRILNAHKIGKENQWKLNDEKLIMDPNFKLFVFSDFDGCKDCALTASKFNIVDFSCQIGGLTRHLLEIFVTKDNPSMEKERISVSEQVLSESHNSKTLKEKLLNAILNSMGTVLDDKTVMTSLESFKSDFLGSVKCLSHLFETEKTLNQQRELFAPSCEKSATFFLMLLKLKYVDVTYNFKLERFIETFMSSIALKIAQNLSPKQRVDFVMEHAENVYQTFVSQLKERHKIIFSFLLCLTILENWGNPFPIKNLEFLLEKLTFTNNRKIIISGSDSWITKSTLSNIKMLTTSTGVFSELLESITSNQEHWLSWLRSDQPEKLPLTDMYENLDPTSKFTLFVALRPDRLLSCVQKYIKEEIGEQFLEKFEPDCSALAANSSPANPIIIIADKHIDVLTALEQLAISVGVSATIFFDDLSEPAIMTIVRSGGWAIIICVETLHCVGHLNLVMAQNDADASFRLWVVMNPSIVLDECNVSWDKCSILTIEKPMGIKDSMQRILQPLNVKHWSQELTQLAWNMALLHTCVLGRQVIVEGEFQKIYDFADSDFTVALSFLEEITSKHQIGPLRKEFFEWVSEIAYSGRMEDQLDQRVVSNIGREILWEHAFSAVSGDNVLKMLLTEDGRAFSVTHLPQESSTVLNFNALAVNSSFSLHLKKSKGFHDDLKKLMVISKNDSKDENHFSKATLKLFDSFFKNLETMEEIKTDSLEKWPKIGRHAILELKAMHAEKIIPMKRRISEMKEVIRGKLMFSETIANAAASIKGGKLPAPWRKKYFQDDALHESEDSLRDDILGLLQVKANVINNFAMNLQNVIPPIRLGVFENPSAFLLALKQDLCQHFNDVFSVSWTFQVLLPDDAGSEKEGVFLDDIYLKGALWDAENGFLKESHDFQSGCQMPRVFMKPSNFVFASEFQDFYMCPVFADDVNKSREPLLTIPLNPGAQSEEHWTRLGVAMYFCTTAFGGDN